ncbi:MAG: methyltransferase [Candidatus Aenigmatarchaeota archaeon]
MAIEIIGNKEKAVAIIEVREDEDEKKLVEEILRKHKNVKCVLKKISERKGDLRLREYELIAGDDTEVVHKEYGYLLKLDPRKVYFSPREAEERQRIAKQVFPGEKILVMFSGVAPYAIAIAKKQTQVEKIYCVEKNEKAHEYAKENVRINKLSDKIVLIHGNVEEEVEKLRIKFDRIVMPLPFGGKNFLDIAFNCIKNGGKIHFYSIVEDENYSKILEEITKIARNFGKEVKILNLRKVSAYAPRKWKVCVDLEVK